MKKTWYVIADAATARVYSQTDKHDELHLEKELNHPESRMKGSMLASDRPGHYQTTGDGHGAYVEKSEPKEFEAERFATEITHYLESGRVQNAFDDLIIVASPHFHGLLNKQMNKHVSNIVSKHIESDLTQAPESQLLELLKKY